MGEWMDEWMDARVLRTNAVLKHWSRLDRFPILRQRYGDVRHFGLRVVAVDRGQVLGFSARHCHRLHARIGAQTQHLALGADVTSGARSEEQ